MTTTTINGRPAGWAMELAKADFAAEIAGIGSLSMADRDRLYAKVSRRCDKYVHEAAALDPVEG